MEQVWVCHILRPIFYQAFATISIFFTILIFILISKRRQKHQLFIKCHIPGPKPSLLTGSYGYILKRDDNPTLFEEFKRKYGNTYGFFAGDIAVVHSCDLDFLKEVFLDQTDVFFERSPLLVDIPLNSSVLFAKHERWKVMRRILSPSFNKFQSRSDKSSQFIEGSIGLLLDAIEKKMSSSVDVGLRPSKFEEARIDVQQLMKAFTLHTISSMSIRLPGIKVSEDEPKVKALDGFLSTSDRGVTLIAVILPFLAPILTFIANNFQYSAVMAEIHRSINKTIDEGLERLKSGKRVENPQLIDTMISFHHEGKLSRREVLGNAEAVLYAGYETTSTTLTYALWALAKYPEIQTKLRDEIIAHGLDSKYLEQVLNETMRLWPVASNFANRSVTKASKYKDFTLPVDTRIGYNTWLVHRNRKYWSNPLQFDPNRFAEGAKFHPCAFAPFGLGERKCLGLHMAMLEMKMVICNLLVRYETRLITPSSLDLTSWAFFLTKPKEKVIIKFRRLLQ